MFLDAMVHVRLANPYITVRYHEGTPYELKVKVAEVVRIGIGHPKMFNDKVAIDSLMRYGVSLEDARDYVNIGCVELEVPGKTCGWHDCCYVTLPKVLELALNNGKCLDCGGVLCPNYNTHCRGVGKSLGLETGYLKDFKTFDEVIAAYEAQLKYWADRAILTVNVLQAVHAERDDSPLTSTVIQGCIESGKSWMNGGAKYNFAGLQCLGPATTADSLTALKKLVYEDKKVTAEEYYDALTKNWEGHERLYQLVNSDKIPHYGNDEDYADEMMQYVFDTYCNLLQSYPPARGFHKIKTGSVSQVMNLIFGMAVGATPDGRRHHEAISANIDPARTAVSNRDRSGPTALSRSIGKIDHAKAASGTLINMKFGVDTISGERGRDNFTDFLDAYLAQGAMHIQFMVTNRETLIEAQKKPEEYRDLLVRVSGFSSYFHSLNTNFQNELINRTEQSFD
jgi:formate C-acetyltransferase